MQGRGEVEHGPDHLQHPSLLWQLGDLVPSGIKSGSNTPNLLVWSWELVISLFLHLGWIWVCDVCGSIGTLLINLVYVSSVTPIDENYLPQQSLICALLYFIYIFVGCYSLFVLIYNIPKIVITSLWETK